MADGIFKSCGVILSGCLQAALKKVWDHLQKHTDGIWLKTDVESGPDL